MLLVTGIIDVSDWSKEHIDELEDLVKRAEQEILTRPSVSQPQQASEFQTVREIWNYFSDTYNKCLFC